jgi:hypothetical protein
MGLPELVTGDTIEQQLMFVTLGEPTDHMRAVIKASRAATSEAP